MASAPSVASDATGPLEIALTGGISARAVARDLFLDGNTFRDGPHVGHETFVGSGEIGVQMRFRALSLAYRAVSDTRSYAAGPKWHPWASMVGAVTFGSLTIRSAPRWTAPHVARCSDHATHSRGRDRPRHGHSVGSAGASSATIKALKFACRRRRLGPRRAATASSSSTATRSRASPGRATRFPRTHRSSTSRATRRFPG